MAEDQLPLTAGRQLAQAPAGPDLDASDWASAHERYTGTADLKSPGPGEVTAWPEGGARAAAAAQARRQKMWLMMTVTVVWTVARLALMGYSTWWTMGYIHAGLGGKIGGLGASLIYTGFRARWKRRFFGPGQSINPELFDEIGTWMYKVGAVVVLLGGAVDAVQQLR